MPLEPLGQRIIIGTHGGIVLTEGTTALDGQVATPLETAGDILNLSESIALPLLQGLSSLSLADIASTAVSTATTTIQLGDAGTGYQAIQVFVTETLQFADTTASQQTTVGPTTLTVSDLSGSQVSVTADTTLSVADSKNNQMQTLTDTALNAADANNNQTTSKGTTQSVADSVTTHQ